MKDTCRDFWKMVHDRKCGVIVMTSDLEEGGQVIVDDVMGERSTIYWASNTYTIVKGPSQDEGNHI